MKEANEVITISKEILSHPDFIENLAETLCENLELLMDEIFESDEEIDFDFIDECAEVINAIRSGNTAQILPVISRKEFFEKLNIKSNNKFIIAASSVAAIALIFFAGTQIKVEENISVIQSLSGIVSDFFKGEQKTEVTTVKEETTITENELITNDITEEKIEIKNITIETTKDFKKEYFVGEKFNNKGIKVFAEYTNGERKLVQAKGYIVKVPETFGQKAGYETVTIKSGDFTETLTVRIIESLSTKKLSSIYAVFPDSFDFTAENLENYQCDAMQVYALYSDGSERELGKDEYTVKYEYEKTFFKEILTVTVEYENCTCSFPISKK